MSSEKCLDIIRKKLNNEKIKLWESPYTVEGSNLGVYPQELLEKFSKDLSLSQNVIKDIFEQLRCHALEKLAARNKFITTGLAVLKLKVLSLTQSEHAKQSTLETSLEISGKNLCQLVANQHGISPAFVKLITQGKVIEDNLSLKEQNVQNNSSIMVMLHSEEASVQEERDRDLHQTRTDAELLSTMDLDNSSNGYNLQIADQNGQVLKLPIHERKALAIAMTLHEKSRVFMKQKKYNIALPILLEADKEFKQCTAEILNLVDNYALINLDIVWCYLCLRSMSYLPDADRRLKLCQSCFDKSYGPNLERLQALKGDKTKERALFARLHLLQGVVAYHQDSITLAQSFLSKVKDELAFLKVDDEKLCQLMAMGYSSTEARLALRTSGGSMEGAVHSIITRKEERALVRKRNEEERKKNSAQRKLGKTVSGNWTNVDFHQSLVNMGYSSSEAQQALQHSDNSVSLAVQILQEQRHLLTPDVDDAAVAKLVSLGFSSTQARQSLESTKGNVETALANLFSGNSSTSSQTVATQQLLEAAGLSSGFNEAARNAVNRLAEEIPEDEEDHLDLSMAEEEVFLLEYISILDSLSSITPI